MPAAKKPAKTETPATPAEAAIAEVRDPAAPYTFEFRGVEIIIPRQIPTSARVAAMLAMGSSFEIIRELLAGDPMNYPRFLSTVTVGEEADDVIADFFGQFNASAGVGNS